MEGKGATPLELGANLAVYLASAQSDGITGKLISAQWDPWGKLHEFKGDLDNDIYTLRRIVPKDRGKLGATNETTDGFGAAIAATNDRKP